MNKPYTSINNVVFFIESKFDLEIINNYIIENIRPNSKLFIICETGEWAINKLPINNKEIEIYFLSSNYDCLEKHLLNYNRSNKKEIYHNIRSKKCYEEAKNINKKNKKFHFKKLKFCLNDLHATILVENTKENTNEETITARGIIFYRPLKSSIISPIFFKTNNLKKYFPGIKFLLDKIEKEVKQQK